MDVDKIIVGLMYEDVTKLRDLHNNASRVLKRQPENVAALRLRSAVDGELARRKMANLKKVGGLWWEPHDPYAPEFFAYEGAHSTVPVAVIFKRATHTATRKDVYSVRVGSQELSEQFSEVALARQAGSEAWSKAGQPRPLDE